MKRLILAILLLTNITANAQVYIIAVDGVSSNLPQRQARQELAQGRPYLGQIMLFDKAQIPYGWMECNGDTLNILDYINLYSVLGNTYGGDGINTFCLPNLSVVNSVLVDTLNGRPIFKFPSYVADLIPDSSHFVVEQDYIEAYSVNTDFATVPENYRLVIVGLDSTELTLPKTTYDFMFEITCFCFDSAAFGVYDTIPYQVAISGTSNFITLYKAQSIIYFSDTIWVDLKDTYKFSNFISTEHPISQFRVEGDAMFFKILWDNKQKKFFKI